MGAPQDHVVTKCHLPHSRRSLNIVFVFIFYLYLYFFAFYFVFVFVYVFLFVFVFVFVFVSFFVFVFVFVFESPPLTSGHPKFENPPSKRLEIPTLRSYILETEQNEPQKNFWKHRKNFTRYVLGQKNHGPFLPSILKPLFQKSFQMSQKGHNPIPNTYWLHLKHILNEPK